MFGRTLPGLTRVYSRRLEDTRLPSNHRESSEEKWKLYSLVWEEFLEPRFENQIERRLRGAAELGKAASGDNFAEPFLPRLRAERQANFLG